MDRRQRCEQVTAPLLDWFNIHARPLPWRRTKDPYAIWVSEIMLQQTRTETVEPYYRRFLRRFPSVESLARARLDTVLKIWEGLGYYARARNMHQAAKRIVRDFAGRLPQTVNDLRRLPGIGRYTASAIASIAFGRDEPVVDGNVTRVLSRVFHLRQDPRSGRMQNELWLLARRMLPSGRAGTFNQALMELGATVCLPRKPLCPTCPLRPLCLSRKRGDQETLPVRGRKKSLPHHTVVVAIIRKQGKILIDKRPPGGLLGGLWEFPGGKKERRESLAAALRREIREELGIEIAVGRRLTTVRHAYSHFTVTIHAFECNHLSGRPRCIHCTHVRWVKPRDLAKYAFPAANKKIIAALVEPSVQWTPQR